MVRSDAEKRADRRYKASKTKQVTVRFYPSELSLYDHVCSKGNKMGYIKGLIADDMEREGEKGGRGDGR